MAPLRKKGRNFEGVFPPIETLTFKYGHNEYARGFSTACQFTEGYP